MSHPTDFERFNDILAEHEIVSLSHFPTGPGGYWVAITVCACGHSSPPEHRAEHLAAVLCKAAAYGLRVTEAFPVRKCVCGNPKRQPEPPKRTVHRSRSQCYDYTPLQPGD